MVMAQNLLRGHIFSVIVSVLLVLTVSSCAIKGKSLSQKDVLSQRASAYWDLVINRQYDQAYQYEYPLFKKEMDVSIYVRKRSNPLTRYKEVEIESIEFREGDVADLEVLFKIELRPPGAKKPGVVQAKRSDRWVKVKGIWYHVSARTKNIGK